MLKEKYHPSVIKPYKPLKAKGQNQESKKSQLQDMQVFCPNIHACPID